MKKKYLYLFWIVVSILPLSACHRQEKESHSTSNVSVTVKKANITHSLSFKGNIYPIAVRSVVSPIDGRIKHMNFVYGSTVRKGQLLMTIDSEKLYADFVTDLQGYLQKKSSMYLQKQNFVGTKMLYKRGVISRNQYLTTKNSFDSAELGLSQAQVSLQKVSALVGLNFKSLSNLNVYQQQNYAEKVKDRFENIKVRADYSGVALFPLNRTQSSSSDDDNGKLAVGSEVKQGALLLSVGDLSGYQITFDVSEISITKIHKGMTATVTGDAFPGVELQGVVSQVASQSTPDSAGSALSLFQVTVKIPSVPSVRSKKIYVGMSCAVNLKTTIKNALTVPLKAISINKDNQSIVKVMGHDGKVKKTLITTGMTTPNGDVSVLSGLSAGDKVLVSHD